MELSERCFINLSGKIRDILVFKETINRIVDQILLLAILLVSLPIVGCQSLAIITEDLIVIPFRTAPYTPNIPKRTPNALTGKDFIARNKSNIGQDRENAILREFISGNIPQFLRSLVPITNSMKLNNKNYKITFWVMPDYLSIGADRNFVRIPMTPVTAQRTADQFGMSLPTTKMVDLTYKQAGLKIAPTYLKSDERMTLSSYFEKHNNDIENKINDRNRRLTAGHKKDIVITNSLNRKKRRVAIYGWHKVNGLPTQPLNLYHPEDYVDYSHGVRLISNIVVLNGKEMTISHILNSKNLHQLLSNEGPIKHIRIETRHRN
ncbi:MAG: hypothetical protein CMP10_05555 [Zetaproteobacteria bacterium]|nr:hypothetical protein [Pseudobdellovibrionaceae bacterium]